MFLALRPCSTHAPHSVSTGLHAQRWRGCGWDAAAPVAFRAGVQRDARLRRLSAGAHAVPGSLSPEAPTCQVSRLRSEACGVHVDYTEHGCSKSMRSNESAEMHLCGGVGNEIIYIHYIYLVMLSLPVPITPCICRHHSPAAEAATSGRECGRWPESQRSIAEAGT